MANSVKMCDMNKEIAAQVLELLNKGKVCLKKISFGYYGTVIVTDVEPKDLVYPEGWYYAKGTFRNKHTSSTGFYGEISMCKSNGESWSESAMYCTLDT